MGWQRIFRLGIVFGAFVILAFSIMDFLAVKGERINKKVALQMQAVMEVKLQISQAHLWFEEIMAGDRTENIETVWVHFDTADQFHMALLNGGAGRFGVYKPLEEQDLRAHVVTLQQFLSNFEAIARARIAQSGNVHAGSFIDQHFDRVFHDYLAEADALGQDLQSTITADLRAFRFLGGALIGAVFLVGTLVSLMILRLELQSRDQRAAIKAAEHEISRKTAALGRMELHDSLTGLPNRTCFLERAEHDLTQAAGQSQFAVLLVLDLDWFKSLGAPQGNEAADRVLQDIAHHLEGGQNSEDVLGRVGRNAFAMLRAGFTSAEQARRMAKEIAAALSKELPNTPSAPAGGATPTAHISTSIGIAIYPNDATTAAELLNNAELARDEVKQYARGEYRLFSEKMSARLAVEQDLHMALGQGQLRLQYQPQWNLCSGKIVGVEALVRWQHPRDGLRGPDSFIPVAEQSDLIRRIDTWVLRTACRQYRVWCDQGNSPGRLSVNISANLFRHKDFLTLVDEVMTDHAIGPDVLELELTETSLLESSTHHRRIMSHLIEQGVRVALDDFGTGHSSLMYLRDYPVSTLKIDRSFVSRVPGDPVSVTILRCIVALTKSLGIDVVAEGVETEAQKDFLEQLNCATAQGYLLSRPMDPAQANILFRKHDCHIPVPSEASENP